ncbi:MAG: phosphoglucosamine mutase [Abditibacteriota bacterium]|nr:phosphoglucosamine mutase [Abditibacteriota bacterium]
MSRYFGTDGIRGIANSQLTPLTAFKLGTALGKWLGETAERPVVVIGKDTRMSGDLLEGALTAGLCSMGTDVIPAGVITTPGVAFLTREFDFLKAGIVISASHNPMTDNGIKVFSEAGGKLPDEVEDKLEDYMDAYKTFDLVEGAAVGRVQYRPDFHEKYIAFLRNAVPIDLSDMKIVVDCANGASSGYAKELFESMGAKVTAINDAPDGVNINLGCGSLHPEGMCSKVTETGSDIGFAFDGDADRVIMSDSKGRVVDGDRMMAIYGLSRKRHSSLPADMVVGTVMSNIGLEKALSTEGITLHRSKVGDRYVSEDMHKFGAIVGGEKSGHIMFHEILPSGDGMLTALMIMKVLRDEKKPLSELSDEIKEYPQLLVNVRVADKTGWDTDPEIAKALAAGEKRLEGRGRIVLRPSGTEQLIRVMAEGPDQKEVDEVVNSIAEAIKKAMG